MVMTSLTKSRPQVSDFFCSPKVSQFYIASKIFNVPSRWVASSLSLLTTPMRSRFSLSVSSMRPLRWSRSDTDDDCELANDDMRVSKSLFDATREKEI